jgi:hypothetical protein
MAIIQISKIQQRSGNLVDLPQLDEAQFGWASDAKRLFIGKTTPNENIEVLTSYSNISFSQTDGAGGSNVNIDANSLQNGQLLTYVETTNTWENYTGNSSQIGNSKIQLGNVGNISMTGGATGFVLQTDGLGNLSWTPKTTVVANIVALSNATPIVMTVNANIPYTNGTQVTISGVNGVANGNVNSTNFYVKLANDFPTTGNVTLYLDVGLTSNSNGTSLTYTNSPNALSISTVGGTSTLLAAGTNTSIQFNNGGTLQGSPYLNILNGNGLLTHTGPYFSVGNVYANSGAVVASQLTGSLMTNAQPNITSTGTLASLSVTANANIGNIGTGGLITATGNITGGNLVGPLASGNSNISITSNANITMYVAGNANARFTATTTGVVANGTFSASGNANVGNLGTGGLITVTGNVTAGNLVTGGAISATGNANVGNLGTGGLITVTGNIGGGNINTGGLISATGNINGGNLVGPLASGNSNISITSNANISMYVNGNANVRFVVTDTGANINGTLSVSGNANVGNLGTAGLITATGNLNAGNIITAGLITATGNLNAGNIITAGIMSSTGNATHGNISTGGLITATGNLNAGNIITGGIVSATGNGTFGNVIATLHVGNLSGTGNSNIGNIGTGIITATGNLNAGNIITGGIVSATGNLQGGNLILANAAIITVGANTNVGTITGNWSLSTGSRLNATYADLAEYYEADSEYEPGTVLEFGGDKEVTIAQDGTTRVAGVVSTNPAYAMNANCQGIAVAIALQGRVPTKVRGVVHKGDMMVSAGNGYARPWNNPQMGTVIGKALENFEGIEGVIEIAVGRL